MSRAYLRWKYLENPFFREPTFIVVRHGDQIVGMRGLYGTCWTGGSAGDSTILPHADDFIVHPDHRKQGLGKMIQDTMVAVAKKQGFPSVISLSGNDRTQEISLAGGWKALGELEQIYRYPGTREKGPRSQLNLLKRGKQVLRMTAKRFGYGPNKVASNRSVNQALKHIATEDSPRVQISSDADYAGMSSLAESVTSDQLRAPRSEAFLRWRLDNPHRKYRFIYWRDSSLRGYMILAWTTRNPYRVIIADHAVENTVVFTELMGSVVRSQRGWLSMMSSTLPDSLLRVARTAGFNSDPSFEKGPRKRFLFYPLADQVQSSVFGESQSTYPSRWHVNLLDTMNS